MQQVNVVFGANGGSGQAIVRELLARGKNVRAVSREGRLQEPIVAANLEVVQGDATDVNSVRTICQDATVVYHAVGLPYQQWYTGLEPIMDAMIAGIGPESAKLVYVDNTYMYGKVSGPMTEDLPYTAADRKGRLRAKLAQKLLAAHRNGQIRATIARGTNFYGPGVLSSILGKSALQTIRAGKKAMWLGRLDMPFSMTYIRDFAKGAVTLGERDEALGQVWHIPAAPPLTGQQFLAEVFAQVGLPPAIGTYTRPMMLLVSPFNSLAREAMSTLYQHEAPYILNATKYTRAFGDFLPTATSEALQQTWNWLRTETGEHVVSKI